MPSLPAKHARLRGPRQHHPKGEAPADRQRKRAMHTGSTQWQAIRRDVLLRDMYRCQCCGQYGNHVDHIDGDSWNNPADGSNWQTLCQPCHARKTATEQNWRRDRCSE